MNDKYLNLTGSLLKMVIEFDTINDKLNDLNNEKNILRDKIIETMEKKDIKKARSQLFNVSYSIVQQKPKISTKKLYEEMIARGLEPLWNSCLYTPQQYSKLTVSKRKGGENIF